MIENRAESYHERLLQEWEWVRRLAAHLHHDWHSAEDIAQDAWLVALRSPPDGRANRPVLRAWLSQVLRNFARMRTRQEVARTSTTRTMFEQCSTAERSDPYLDYERSELVALVSSAVDHLEEPYRSAVMMRYWENRSISEVAQRFGVSPAAARKRLSRGIQRLRTRLETTHFGARGTAAMGLAVLFPWSGELPKVAAGTSSTLKVGVVARSLVAVVSMGTGLWFAVEATKGEFVDDTGPQSSFESSSRLPRSADSHHGDPLTSRTTEPIRVDSSSILDREPSRDPRRISDIADHCHDVVIVSRDGEVVPGAEVAFVETHLVSRLQLVRVLRETGDRYEAFRRLGGTLRADAHGRVAVPRSPRLTAIAARRGEERNCHYLAYDAAQPVRLALRELGAVEVRVLDSLGRPLSSLPVSVREVKSADLDVARWSGLTGEDGTFSIANPGLLLGETFRGRSFVAELALPLARPVQALFDPLDPPSKALELALPPSGSMEIELVDEAGNPCRHSPDVVLRGVTTGARGQETVARSGRAYFPFVEVGATLELLVDGVHVPPRSRLRGPTAEGDRVQVRVVVPERAQWTGLLLLPSGAPLADAWIRAEWKRRGTVYERIVIETDERGAFSIDAVPSMSSLCFSYRPPRQVSALIGTFAIPTDPETLVTDLGRVVLVPEPALAAGRVLRADGRPASFAKVRVTEDRSQSPGAGSRDWVCRTDREGRFVVHGTARDATLQLEATAGHGREVGTASLEVGAKDIEIALHPAGAVEGWIMADAEVPVDRLEVRLDIHTASGDSVSFAGHPQRSGSFRFGSLPAGAVSVSVAVDSRSRSLAEIEDTTVHLGPGATGLKLDPIDLRGRIECIQMDVVDDRGRPLDGVQLQLSDAHGQLLRTVSSRSGKLLALSESRPSRALLTARGYRSVSISGPSRLKSVVLQPAIPVELQVPRGDREAPAPWGICLTPIQTSVDVVASSSPPRGRISWVRDQNIGTALLQVATAGRYRVEYLHRSGEGPSRSRTPEIIEIAETSADQSFLLIPAP